MVWDFFFIYSGQSQHFTNVNAKYIYRTTSPINEMVSLIYFFICASLAYQMRFSARLPDWSELQFVKMEINNNEHWENY